MAVTDLRRSGAIVVLAALAGSALAAAAPTAKRPLSSDDLYRMEAVSEPQISPDGQWVAYLVSTSDRDADEGRAQIHRTASTRHAGVRMAATFPMSPRSATPSTLR